MCNCKKNNTFLSSPGISLNQVIEAMTDPNKRFEFPIKPPTAEVNLSKQTKVVIIGAALILGGALIYSATRR